MPIVAAWADDLRSAFGAEEFNEALRKSGYFASENGRTIDTRKLMGGAEISARDMVIRPLPELVEAPRRGR
jgi:hypothetical protein